MCSLSVIGRRNGEDCHLCNESHINYFMNCRHTQKRPHYALSKLPIQNSEGVSTSRHVCGYCNTRVHLFYIRKPLATFKATSGILFHQNLDVAKIRKRIELCKKLRENVSILPRLVVEIVYNFFVRLMRFYF